MSDIETLLNKTQCPINVYVRTDECGDATEQVLSDLEQSPPLVVCKQTGVTMTWLLYPDGALRMEYEGGEVVEGSWDDVVDLVKGDDDDTD